MEIKFANPNLGQDPIAKKLDCSSSSLQRYRNYITILSPYRITAKSHKRRQKFQIQTSMILQIVNMTSKDLIRPQKTELVKPKSNTDSVVNCKTNKKRKLKSEPVHDTADVYDESSDEILHNNNL